MKDLSLLSVLQMIGSLGLFIYGMKLMSDGIQKVAGERLRQILTSMTANRVLGVTTGIVLTSVIQSSSATTVLVVSFVNAGMLTLTESIGVIMGANIGTTITGWLVSILGFKIKISQIILPAIAIAFPMMFSGKSSLKSWSEFIMGFAILFMGLEALRDSVPDLKSNPEALEFLKEYATGSFLSLLLFILIGTIITLVVQSSSAAMAITLIMCHEGWIGFETGAAIILGENIGTTVTANIAAVIANVNAKRAALAHTMFNVIGVLWMLLAFPLFIDGIDSYIISSTGESALVTATAVPIALSIFHTGFNLVNTLILIWFVNPLERLVIFLLPSRNEDDEQTHLEYITAGIMNTPELSLVESQKEIIKFASIDIRMLALMRQLVEKSDKQTANEILKQIEKYEEITDKIEIEVSNYLTKVAEGEISESASATIRNQFTIIGNLERIGDIFYQMSKTIERKMEERTWFTPEQRKNLLDLMQLIDESFEIMLVNLQSEVAQKANLSDAKSKEIEINRKRNEMRVEHFENLGAGVYNIKSGIVYMDLFSSLERIGDHVINVSEAIKGEI